MYAIIADSGRQYRVEEGQEVVVDYRDIPHGEQVQFDRVLMISSEDGVQLGKPVVEGAIVTAEVLGPIQGEKIYVQKFRRRKNSRRRTGHRQIHTTVKIAKIEVPSLATAQDLAGEERDA
jgi:large subunit ribosomal protein L21